VSKPRESAKNKRKNPAFKSPFPVEMITNAAGTMIVTAALSGCTFQEKALVGAMIPTLLKLIRSVPKNEVEAAVYRLWPPEPEESSSTQNSNQPSPTVVNQKQ